MPRLDQEGFPTKPQPILTEGTYTSPNPSLLYQAGIPTQPILTRRAQPIPMGCQPILTRRAQPIPMVCQPILTRRVFPRISVVLNILTHPDQEGIPPIPVVWVGGVGWGGRKTCGGGRDDKCCCRPNTILTRKVSILSPNSHKGPHFVLKAPRQRDFFKSTIAGRTIRTGYPIGRSSRASTLFLKFTEAIWSANTSPL